MKKFEPHYRLVRYGAASKIEKASRQQRTYDGTSFITCLTYMVEKSMVYVFNKDGACVFEEYDADQLGNG